MLDKIMDYIEDKYDNLFIRLRLGPAPHKHDCFCKLCNEYWEAYADGK